MRQTFCTLFAIAVAAAPATAQPSAHADSSYAQAALAVVPRWSGLALARGAAGRRVGELGFFVPGDVRPAFAGSDSALHYAARAVSTRRVAAVLTDVGLLALGAGAIRMTVDGHARGSGAVLAGAGAVFLGASVPAQFAADGWLSRAVWWHNARFAR